MCANCGFPSAPGHWTEAGASDAGERIRGRLRRAAVLKPVLAAYGLTAHDDGVSPGLIVADRTGRHEMVADLAELWAVAETIGGRPVDPLDPLFLEGDDDGAG